MLAAAVQAAHVHRNSREPYLSQWVEKYSLSKVLAAAIKENMFRVATSHFKIWFFILRKLSIVNVYA